MPALTHPIAVVGMACRFPGAHGPEEFWSLLLEGRDAIGPAPQERGLTDPGGYLDDVARFDADLFGVSPRAALFMDPHQRIALELAWEACEDAAVRPDAQGIVSGVFVGGMSGGYEELLAGRASDPNYLLGNTRGLIANRISHALHLDGPSMTLDCGQSSSLAAVVMAVRSLRAGDCDVALAGGVNLILTQSSTEAARAFGALSPTFRCRPFDDRADGYVRGEGGAMLVLRRLADAERDGDAILAVLRGAALNNDAGVTSLAVPSVDGQRIVLNSALTDAAVLASDMSYVELHGTGTKVGDPLEAEALGMVYEDRPTPLSIGSVKSNIGHLEGASGIAGLVKGILALKHGVIPPNHDVGQAPKALRLEERGLRVVAQPEPLPAGALVGVSSFGMGGSNAHVILGAGREAVTYDAAPATGDRIWLITAPLATLPSHASRLAEATVGLDHGRVAATLWHHRPHVGTVAALVGSDTPELVAGLRALAEGRPHPDAFTGPRRDGRVTVLFSGQGAQRLGMGTALATTYPAFAAPFHELLGLMSDRLGVDLAAIVRGCDRERLMQTRHTQAALVAFEVAGYRLLQSFGLAPDLLVGHSIGEIAAAHVAGVLSAEDAATLVAARGDLMQQLPAGGGMLAVHLPEHRAKEFIDGRRGVAVAAVNSPHSIVVAGPLPVLEDIDDTLPDDVRRRLLAVSHAFHSPLMDPMLDEFRDVASSLTHHLAQIPVVSCLDGQVRSTFDAEHWVRHARETVRFLDATRTAQQLGAAHFVEVGPQPTLLAMVEQTLGAGAATLVPLCRETCTEARDAVRALAALGAAGAPVDWTATIPTAPRVPLPALELAGRRYWPETAAQAPTAVEISPGHEDEPAPRAMSCMARLEAVLASLRIVLGHTPDAELDPDLTFKAHGLTSQGAVELCELLSRSVDVPVSAAATYDHPTPRRLAEVLVPDEPVAETVAVATDDAHDDPIAIVGMDCRFPGASGTEALWQLVAQERDAVGAFPDDRGWELSGLFDDDPDTPGTSHTCEGGFLADATTFDAGFFGISAREAQAMDPQQRKALETVWHALEAAGIDAHGLQGTRTGVFMGAMPGDYGPDFGAIGPGTGHRLTGTDPSIISGRIAYTLGLTGPAMTVDTACSSSLVAIHLAVNSLRCRETNLALAGGVTVMSTPGMFVELTKLRAVSPRGRCRAFADDADGTGWGEGCGVLVLERLSDARANGHHVLGLVRGTAVNEDGASNGLTAPNGTAQRCVILDALADASLTTNDVDVVEAHGTGTALGDPIEAEAVLATYGADRVGAPVLLGSLKSNIAHSQAAAGVGGVIKMVLAMQHRWVPKTLNADRPSRHVDWASGAVQVANESQPWPLSDHRPRAGVSSFGIGGTNAHVIVEGPSDDAPEPQPGLLPDECAPLLISAPDKIGIERQADKVAKWLRAADVEADALARGLARRAHLAERAALLPGLDPERGLAILAGECPRDGEAAKVLRGSAKPRRRVAFVFPGQGSQWPGMGTRLLSESPLFAAHVDACDAAFRHHLDWSVRDLLASDDSVDWWEEATAQPVLFTMMTGLALLWREAGLEPTAVVGHSQGEVAAAWFAGALTLEEAVAVIAYRSGAWSWLVGHKGAMFSVSLPRPDVEMLLQAVDGEVGIAAVNGRGSVIVSGERQATQAFVASIGDDVKVKPLTTVKVAGHSPVLEPIRSRLADALRDIHPQAPRLVMYSTVTGSLLNRALDAGYWCDNMIGTVDFLGASEAMLEEGIDAFVEISAHPVLGFPLQQTIEATGSNAAVIPTLRRGEGGVAGLAAAFGHGHVNGLDLDWRRVLGDGPSAAPGYAFSSERHWVAPPSPTTLDRILLRTLPRGRAELEWRGEAAMLIDEGVPSIAGRPVVCAATVASLAQAAGSAVGLTRLTRFTVSTLAVPQADGPVTLLAEVDAGEQERACRVSLHCGDDWVELGGGTVAPPQEMPLIASLPPVLEPLPAPTPDEAFVTTSRPTGRLHDCDATWLEVKLPAQPDSLGHTGRVLRAVSWAQAGEHRPAILPIAFDSLESQQPRTDRALVRITCHDDVLCVDAFTPDGQRFLNAAGVVVEDETLWRDRLMRLGEDALWSLTWIPCTVPPSGTMGVVDRDPATGELRLTESNPDSALWTLTSPESIRLDEFAARLAVWGGSAEFDQTALVIATRHATIATAPGGAPDPGAAAVWGLVRAAQAEFPGRFRLLDLDDAVDEADVHRAARTDVSELALVGARLHSPIVTPVKAGMPMPLRRGTVLITGGTGALAALAAEDLVVRAGATNLWLVSRRAEQSDAVTALIQRLEQAGARARAVSCDVSDRAALQMLLEQIPADEPLIGVVHTAGALVDGLLATQDAAAFATAFGAKVEGAKHLDELTRGLGLDFFVLYSSVVGTFGNAGQASYAAANAALDAIAFGRRAAGESATSIAWGLWNTTSGLVAEMRERDVLRFSRRGLLPLEPEFGRILLLQAISSGVPSVVATQIDRTRIAEVAGESGLPQGLRALAPESVSSTGHLSSADRFSQLDAERRLNALRSIVRDVTAGILADSTPETIDMDAPFRDLGFDSLMGVELRNHLSQEMGQRLPATLIFDYPRPEAVAQFLDELIGGQPDIDPAPMSESAVPEVTHDGETVAIVAVACRLPGGITSPEQLWEALEEERDLVGPMPTDRGWPEDLHNPQAAGRGYSIAGEGGFLDDAAYFDPGFFAISDREAKGMDPQQRLLLQVAWEALERGGIDPRSLKGSSVGVYIGNIGQAYTEGMSDDDELSGYLVTGGSSSILSGRLSYVLGINGPSLSVDTGCSSSLVATHLAVSAIRQGECDMALVGGVTIMATPDLFVEFTRQGGMAPDGRCKAFSDAADGTGWAEGVVVLILERLSEARRLRHRIVGLIRGSAVNQDGASNGLTAPNGASQQAVIRAALADAGLTSADVDLVEAHGTGTVLGDPIEAQAILATYGRDRREPIAIGSLKSNTGHTQGAAGAAGILKVLLSLEHGLMPRTLHCSVPSRHVDWEQGDVRILSQAAPWPAGVRVRRGGVSAFGISGTNAHVIVEEPPAAPVPAPAPAALGASMWPISARTPEALRARAHDLLTSGVVDDDPERVGRGLGLRSNFEERAVIVAEDPEMRREALSALAHGGSHPGLILGTRGVGRTAFIFSGQGTQHPGMGAELGASYPVFARAHAEALEACVAASAGDLAGLVADPARLGETAVAQPAIFAFEVAAFRLWEFWGIRPDIVAGHSIGEIAAAHCAGVLSLEDAARLVTQRGRLMQELPGGAMLALRRPVDEVEEVLRRFPTLSLAAINGPESVVVAGPTAQVEALAAECPGTRLNVSHAFHSAMMAPMLPAFADVVAGLTFHEPSLACVSATRPGSAETLWTDPQYWVEHVSAPVCFDAAVEVLVDLRVGRILEVGPDAALTPLVRQSRPHLVIVPTVSRRSSETTGIRAAFAGLHNAGHPVDWTVLQGGREQGWADTPTYAFQTRPFWRVPSRLACRTVDGPNHYRTVWQDAVPGRPLTADVLVVAPIEHRELAETWARALDRLGASSTVMTLPASGDLPLDLLEGGTSSRSLLVSLGTLPTGTGARPPINHAAALGRLAAGGRQGRQLVFVTRDAVRSEVCDPDQAAVWGYAKTLGLEIPSCLAAILDVAPDVAADDVARVILGCDGEDQWSLAAQGAFVPRIEACELPAGRGLAASGTVLITGGTGGIGAAIAKEYAQAGALRIALLSRRGPDAPGAQGLAQELQALGCEVEVVSCDVSNRGDLIRAVEDIESHGDAITAVVHTAGTVEFAPIPEVDDAALARMASGKVDGARYLDEIFAGRRLDAFVVCSSVAATWGSGGQAAYASANAWLDGLARRRRARGETAHAIAWGPWGDHGMIEGDGVRETLLRRGLRLMDEASALESFKRVLVGDEPCPVVASMDWVAFGRLIQGERRRPFFERVIPVGDEPSAAAADRSLGDVLRGLPASERVARCTVTIREIVAAVLGADDTQTLSLSVPFKDLGFDSLMAVDLRDQLRVKAGISVSSSVIYDYPNVVSLAAHVLQLLVPEDELADATPRGALALDDIHDAVRDASTPELLELIDSLTSRS